MKKLFLIRHAKSSWSDPSVSDFHRKLNKRGKRDGPFMARKLAERGVVPDLIISSPAKRAKQTARFMADAVGYDGEAIVYNEQIYSSATGDFYAVLRSVDDSCNVLFFVGHNFALTDIAEELTREELVNVPTSGIVAMECNIVTWRDIAPGCASMIFFDFPKRYRES